MDTAFRRAQPADWRETENVTREAFWNHFAPGADEHYLLHRMRAAPAFVPELDTVALRAGKTVGNAVYMRALLQTDAGQKVQVLTLGPIAVLPACQRQGVGGGLLAHTRRLAAGMGFRAVLLYGDPAYYSRHGFVPAETLAIRTPDGFYADALQACELYEGALAGMAGRYFEDAIYEVDPAAATAFDEGFPAKERVAGTPSQRWFQEMSARRRRAGEG